MTKRCFPDVNVWFALALADHPNAEAGGCATSWQRTAGCGDDRFRALSAVGQASPKLWVDAYLSAYAAASEAMLVTFDRAFTKYGVECRILQAR